MATAADIENAWTEMEALVRRMENEDGETMQSAEDTELLLDLISSVITAVPRDKARMRDFLDRHDKFVRKLVVATRGHSSEAKEAALTILLGLAAFGTDQEATFATNDAVVAGKEAALRGETPEIRDIGLRLLASLSGPAANKKTVFETEGVVTAATEAAARGETPGNREEGLQILGFLASHSANVRPMFEKKGVVEAAKQAALVGETPNIKKLGVQLLRCLSWVPTNRDRLARVPGVVEAAERAARYGEMPETRENGLILLWNLSDLGSGADWAPTLTLQAGVMVAREHATLNARSGVRDAWVRVLRLTSDREMHMSRVRRNQSVVSEARRATELGESVAVVRIWSALLGCVQ